MNITYNALNDVIRFLTNDRLFIAIRAHDLNEVNNVLDHGANINHARDCNHTPLHVAALHGNVDMVKLLLDRGANLGCLNLDGHSPLMLAEMQGHDAVADLLAEYETKLIYDDNFKFNKERIALCL